MFEKNENERTVFTVIVDHTAKTVGIKWLGNDGNWHGVVIDDINLHRKTNADRKPS